MRRLLLLVLSSTLLAASPALAAAPGVNLGWTNCQMLTNSDRSFACDDNETGFNLVGSFRLGFAVPDFIGVTAILDFSGGGTISPWMDFKTGGCREGSANLQSVPLLLSGCTRPYHGNQAGGYYPEVLGSDRYRLHFDWIQEAGAALSPIAANTLYSAFLMRIDTALSWDEGNGSCGGCQAPACIVLNAMEIWSLSSDRVAIIEQPDFRNYATWQGGTGNCPGETPTRSTTWGAVKALYR